jgi:hypothetical protein
LDKAEVARPKGEGRRTGVRTNKVSEPVREGGHSLVKGKERGKAMEIERNIQYA